MRLTAFFLALALSVALPGCYMIQGDLVGMDVGVIVTNMTPLDLEILQNGVPLPARLHPTETLVIRVMERFENKTETTNLLVKAWSLDGTVLAGVCERSFQITHSYSAPQMSYQNNGRQSWIVRVSDLSR